MANFPPIFITASGLHERLRAGDGGLEIDVIDCETAGSSVNLFHTVTSAGGGSVALFDQFESTFSLGAALSTASFLGGLSTVGTGVFGGTVTVGNTSAAPTLQLGGGDVNKYIDAAQGLPNTPSIRYNASSNRWQFTDDGIIWYVMSSGMPPISTWDTVYAEGPTLDISTAGLVWTQTGSNTGVALTVTRALAAGDTNGALVSFSATGDQHVFDITNSSSSYALYATLDNAIATAMGIAVSKNAAHTGTNPGFQIWNAATSASVWAATLDGNQLWGVDGVGAVGAAKDNRPSDVHVATSVNVGAIAGAGNDGTRITLNDITLGHGTADKTITADQGGANNPAIKYNNALAKWEISNDGTSWVDAGGGSTFDTDVLFSPGLTLRTFHQTVALDLITRVTMLGFTPTGMVLGAAIRVASPITGLPAAEHKLSVACNGGTDIATIVFTTSGGTPDIPVNTKASYGNFNLVSHQEFVVYEFRLYFWLEGGLPVVPTGGTVEVEVHYFDQAPLADV